jgi:hypothetical protein
MQITLENIEKATTNSPINAVKKKNRVEKGRTLSSRMKREHENIDARAQKMMKGRMKPFAMPTMVHVVPIVV